MDHQELAARLFCGGYNCAQAVVVAFSDVTGLDRDFSAGMASSFGGAWGGCGRSAGPSAGC